MSLVPDSCTLITTEFHAKEIGLDVKDIPRLRQTLERQAEFVKSNSETPGDSAIEAGEQEKR